MCVLLLYYTRKCTLRTDGARRYRLYLYLVYYTTVASWLCTQLVAARNVIFSWTKMHSTVVSCIVDSAMMLVGSPSLPVSPCCKTRRLSRRMTCHDSILPARTARPSPAAHVRMIWVQGICDRYMVDIGVGGRTPRRYIVRTYERTLANAASTRLLRTQHVRRCCTSWMM